MDVVDLRVCATHTEQLKGISEDLQEIKGDIRIIAAHAEAIGELKRRMAVIEGQMNLGKVLGAVGALAAALVAYVNRIP